MKLILPLMGRRQFLIGSVAASVTGVLTGKIAGAKASHSQTGVAEASWENKTPAKTIQADVVVLGAGAGGMTAAIRARQQGVAKVVILEKRAEVGGNAAFAPWPAAPEKTAREVFLAASENTHWGGDSRIIGTLVDKHREISGWLAAFARDVPAQTRGGMLVNILKRQCETLGIDILCNTRARKILKDEEDWTCGVLADQESGRLQVTAPVTVLATGGFLGDEQLMETYFPCYDEHFAEEVGIEGLTYSGDGIKMALEAGVGNDGTIAFEWSTNRLPFYRGEVPPVISHLADNRKTPEALWVNNVGVRFTNESKHQAANAIYRQPNKDCFIVLDEGVVSHLAERHPDLVSLKKLQEALPPLIEANQALVVDSVSAVAAWIRGKKHILQHAIDVYNASCEKGLDDLYYKDPAALVAFRKPPFYVFRSGLSLRTTHGPLKVNPMMSCVSRFDFPIPGLMACGADIGGLYADRFISSTESHAIEWTMASALGAGENAAAFVQGNRPVGIFEFPKYTAREVMAGNYVNVGTVDTSKMPAGMPEMEGKKSYH